MDMAVLDAVELTKQLVQIESTNPGTYEKAIGDFIFHYLEEAGVKPERSEVETGRSNIRAVIGGLGAAPEAHPALHFICHMDTVVVGAGWDQDVFSGEVQDGRLYGRGACDMKSGLACALSVFAETAAKVRAGELKLSHPLVFIGTVDEEGDKMCIRDSVMAVLFKIAVIPCVIFLIFHFALIVDAYLKRVICGFLHWQDGKKRQALLSIV